MSAGARLLEFDLWRRTLDSVDRVPPVYRRRVPRADSLPGAVCSWEGDPWVLVIHGPVGAGKTWLAVQILGELRVRGRECRFASSVMAAEAMRLWPSQESVSELRDLCAPRRVLLLDELDAVPDDGSSRERFSQILRARFYFEAATIITVTNLDKFFEDYPREASRLGEGIFFEVSGEDRRLR